MEDKILVIGHKNPDTDSICAAIGYCYYKRETGLKSVYAARLGSINKETEFVLDYFGVDVPDMVTTVKTQVKDANVDQVVSISPEISIRKAWNIMKGQNVKSLPVINELGHLIGVCTLSDLTSSYMDVSSNNLFSRSKTNFKNILETITGRVINNQIFDFSRANKIIVAAMEADEIENRVRKMI
jgi:manganese-dependent inorganic pyrophosphatase